jgi:hypothetical protein
LNVVIVSSKNVVSTTTTQSFVPILPPHDYCSFVYTEYVSNSSLPSTLNMTNKEAEKMFGALIEGPQAAAVQQDE